MAEIEDAVLREVVMMLQMYEYHLSRSGEHPFPSPDMIRELRSRLGDNVTLEEAMAAFTEEARAFRLRSLN